ncbi:MAG: transmembrane 220 family protein [Saprospiraceae bacterium]|nr:transmembrane 220 family protein [Saprospiraceae bacterium]
MRTFIYWTLAVVFVLFALVQYNDPDPLQWILLYGGVAVLYSLAARGRVYRQGVWLWLLAALVWAATLLPAFLAWIDMGEPSIVESMKAEKPWVELTREFLGLTLAALACAGLLWNTRLKSNQ